MPSMSSERTPSINFFSPISSNNASSPQSQKDDSTIEFSKSNSSRASLDGEGDTGEDGLLADLEKLQNLISTTIRRNKKVLAIIVLVALLAAWHAYLAVALYKNYQKAKSLMLTTGIVWVYIFYQHVVLRYFGCVIAASLKPVERFLQRVWPSSYFRISVYAIMISCILIFIAIDTGGDRTRLVGLGGMTFLIMLMVICSKAPSRIDWRPVIVGFTLQFCFALVVLRWKWGEMVFNSTTKLIIDFLDFTDVGTAFVYGFVAAPPNICGMDPIFAFKALQVILYFGAVVSLLYYYGVMQFVLKRMAWLVQITLGTTATESLNACACVFLGMSEAPLMIRPYIVKMTPSEIHAVMTSGFSCIAGSLFAAYIAFGACPTYLLSATFMSAPGSLACSKILYPEVEDSQLKTVKDLELEPGTESSALECISNGAMAGIGIIAAIVANLIVFLALLAFINSTIAFLGDLIGFHGWSVELLFGYIFYPLAFIMGVTEGGETLKVASLMGTKTILNEFIAYRQLGELVAKNELTHRAAMIATYALCGFSNLSSIGIQLGVLGGIAPSRKALFSKLAFRALFAGSISCFMTASLAGILVESPILCQPHSTSSCFDVEKYTTKTIEASTLAGFTNKVEL